MRIVWAVLALVAISPFSVASAQDGDGRREHPEKPTAEPTSQQNGGDENGKKEYLKPFPAGPQETWFKENLGSDYKVRRTDHFFVIYNAKEPVVADLIPRLERTYESVHRLATELEIKIQYPQEKLAVVFCSDIEEFLRQGKRIGNRDLPRDLGGIFLSAHNCALFFDMSKAPTNREQAEHAGQLREQARNSKDPAERKRLNHEAQRILNRIDVGSRDGNRVLTQHEVAHQVLWNLGVDTAGKPKPAWFNEGLACQFEPPPGKMGAGFNVINQRYLGGIRRDYKKELPDLRAFVGDTERSAAWVDGHGYDLSWALVHYLIKQRGQDFRKYVELLNTREFRGRIPLEQEIADFEKCFGKLDENFTKRWHAYIMSLPYRP